jgi:hypothetical protein
VRLLRWLGSGKPSATEIRRRAGEAIQKCLVKAERERGLLDILIGDIQHAAKLLGGAPGLGWSGLYHPGHLLFPALAGLLAEGRSARLSSRLFAELEDLPQDPFDFTWTEDEGPRLETPSITVLIAKARPAELIDINGRKAALEAMKTAAKKRIEGVLDKKRRRSYGHAATLVACCFELAPAVGMQEDISRWVEDLRRECRRFVAFRLTNVLIMSTFVPVMSTNNRQGVAEELLGRTRAAVLSTLYLDTEPSMYVREIIRATGISPGGIQRELRNLERLNLVVREEQSTIGRTRTIPSLRIFADCS